MWSLLIHEHGMYFHLCPLSFFFSAVFCIFYYISLWSPWLILKYCVLFGALGNGIVFIISFSDCSFSCVKMHQIFVCSLYVLLLCLIHLLVLREVFCVCESFSVFCVCACSVTQPCLTLCDTMDCSPPGSSVFRILQARMLEWETSLVVQWLRLQACNAGAPGFDPWSENQIPHAETTVCCNEDWRSDLAQPNKNKNELKKHKNTGVGCLPSSRGSSWPRDQTCVSCIIGRFFTSEPLENPTVFKLIRSYHPQTIIILLLPFQFGCLLILALLLWLELLVLCLLLMVKGIPALFLILEEML